MHEQLYHDLAHLWPLLSPPEDYAAEAQRIGAWMAALAPVPPGGRWRVLELGAGGGHTLHHLQATCDCTATDLSEAMLANCRRLNPGMPAIVGDMRALRLNQTFDVVLLHDAIDYMTTRSDALAALRTAAAHLAPGGLVIAGPTYTSETFEEGESEQDATETEAVAIHFVSRIHTPDPSVEAFEMTIELSVHDRTTGRSHHLEDHHHCGLFSDACWVQLLQEAGFTPLPLPPDAEEPWTPYLGRRRGILTGSP